MRVLFIALVLGVSIVSPANAAIIDNDWYTTDTESGLDWLDVTETVGMSYNIVFAQLVTGGTYEGWRYATGDEVNTLVSNALSISPAISTYSPYSIAENPLFDDLIQTLGSTYAAQYPTTDCDTGTCEPGTGLHYTSGILSDTWTFGGGFHFVAHLADAQETDPYQLANDASVAHLIAISPTQSSPDVGSFLVRPMQPVPEPAAWSLMVVGLLGLFGVHRPRVKS
jgi:hypothetical protein